MKLIITEKPSVAKDFALAISGENFTKKDGYFECGEYSITWAFGHILKVDDSIYNNGPWSFDSLPILPQKFDYTTIDDKKKQLITIIGLLKKCDSFIVATDAGREGELIAREILIYSKTATSKGYRFWSSEALSPQVVIKGLKEIKPLSNYDSLFYSAYARQISDWIVGINFTRFFSLTAKETWSVGRVQTPTLSLIVHRHSERSNFVPQKYFTVTASLSLNNTNFSGQAIQTEQRESPEKFNEELADLLISSLKPTPKEIVCINTSEETITKNPPLLHSLTSLQREANRKYGYTAQQTLNIAQQLYETHKCISYPRSDSNHLAESSVDMANEKLKLLSGSLDTDINRPQKRVFDTSKLTDHHAIIPLNNYKGSDTTEQNVYNLILNTFLRAFMKPFVYNETKITFSTPLENVNIVSRGRTIIEQGWRNLKDKNTEEDLNGEENTAILPKIIKEQKVLLLNGQKNTKFTEPPKIHTDDSILALMEKNNLGTPATRASILERLFSVSYLNREKKNIIPTEKGIELIEILLKYNSPLHSAEVTSNWENELESIQKKDLKEQGYLKFVSQISSFTSNEIKTLMGKGIEISSSRQATAPMLNLAKKIAKEKFIKDFDKKNTSFEYIQEFISSNINSQPNIPCPCGSGNILNDKYYFFCNSCKKKISKSICEKTLSIENVTELLSGKSPFVKGMKSKKGSKFDAYLTLEEDNKIKFSFK